LLERRGDGEKRRWGEEAMGRRGDGEMGCLVLKLSCPEIGLQKK